MSEKMPEEKKRERGDESEALKALTLDAAKQDALDIENVREKIEAVKSGSDKLGNEETENKRAYARGYQHKDGSPVTMEEFRKVSDEFSEKKMTKFMTKFGFWSDFDKRRALDQYLIKQGYMVWKQRGSRTM